MTVRDLIERLREAPFDGMPVVIRDAEGYYADVELVVPSEGVNEGTCVVLVTGWRSR